MIDIRFLRFLFLSKRIVFSKNFLTVIDWFYSLFFHHYLLRSYTDFQYPFDIMGKKWDFLYHGLKTDFLLTTFNILNFTIKFKEDTFYCYIRLLLYQVLFYLFLQIYNKLQDTIYIFCSFISISFQFSFCLKWRAAIN